MSGSRRIAREKRAGCTMVELMVAVGIMLVTVMAAFSGQLTSMGLVGSSRETTAAISDLQACMEQLLTLQLDEIPVPGSDYEADQPVAVYEERNLASERIVASYPGYVVGDPVPNPLSIVLTCTWTECHSPAGKVLSILKRCTDEVGFSVKRSALLPALNSQPWKT